MVFNHHSATALVKISKLKTYFKPFRQLDSQKGFIKNKANFFKTI